MAVTALINRRIFVLAGAAGALTLAGSPLAQTARVRRVAIADPFLTVAQLADAGLAGQPVEALGADQAVWRVFFRELQQRGWSDGATIAVERWSTAGVTDAAGRAAIIEAIRASAPDVIVVVGDILSPQLTGAIVSIPVVVQVGDPVALGVVGNVGRPEGNATGVMLRPGGDAAFTGRLIQLLTEMVPAARRVAWLSVARDFSNAALAPSRNEVIATLAAQGVAVEVVVSDPPSFDPAVHEAWMRSLVAGLSERGFQGVFFGNLPEFVRGTRDPWTALLLEARLPSVTNAVAFVRAMPGALMSYGSNISALAVQRAAYVDQILRGTPISDLPFVSPTEWLLTINQRVASALGVTIPAQYLAMATEIIE